MRVLGVIPARGGSKGIPSKNLIPLNGTPLIEYTIDAAMESLIDRVVVSTDSNIIAEHCGCEVLLRPPALAQDDTPTLPVIQHALRNTPGNYDAVMVLQPTSPLRTATDIDMAIKLFTMYPAECLVSVCEGIHPMKSYDQDHKPFLAQIPYDKHKHKCYTRNGAIFITSKSLLDSGRLFDDQPLLYVMPKSRSIDIDDYEDLAICEALIKTQGGLV